MPNKYPSLLRTICYIPLIAYMPLFLLRTLGGVPYHLYLDSNLTYAFDSLLFNGGLMPGHLFHPDIATLWFEKIFIFPMAKVLGIISISTFQEFQASSNPYLNIVDIIEFLKMLRFSYLYMASGVFYIAMLLLFKDILKKLSTPSATLVVGALAFCSFQYLSHSQEDSFLRVRYETMAVLWGAMSFLMMVFAAQTNQKRYIMLMGLFGGMGFLSKIVVLPSLILYIMLYFILNSYYRKEEDYHHSLHDRLQTRALSVASSLVILASIFLALFLFLTKLVRETGYTSTVGKYIGFTSAPFILLVIILPILSGILCKFHRSFTKFFYYVDRFVLYLLCFYGPLLLQLFQKNGIHLFTTAYLFSFGLGQISVSKITGYNDSLQRVSHNFSSIMVVILLLLIIISISFLIYALKTKKHRDLLVIALSLATIPLMITLNGFFLRRGGNEVNLGFYSLFTALAVLVFLLYQKSPYLKILLTAAVLVILFQAYYQSHQIKTHNLDTLYGNSWHQQKNDWFWQTYGGADSVFYSKVNKEKYLTEENWEKAFYWARDIGTVKRLLRLVGGSPNRLQDSLISFKGAKLSAHETLQDVSSELENSLVLPISSNGSLGTYFDHGFYIATDNKIVINEENITMISLTPLKFNNYFIYKLSSGINYPIIQQQIKYVIISDQLAKSI